MIERRRYMGGKKSILPSGYKQLEYIENTSYAYIDTGFIYKVAPRIVTKVLSRRVYDEDYFGVSNNTIPSWIGDFTRGGSYYRYGPTTSYGWVVGFPAPYTNVWREWDMGRYIYVDGVYLGDCGAFNFSTNTQSVRLFIGRPNLRALCAYQRTQLYDGDTLCRDYIPCINPNNVVGMYDLVEGMFYSSPNGVAFIAGPEV